MGSIDVKFKKMCNYYIAQSFFASVAVFIVLLVLGLQRAVIIASIGASAFIVFAMPSSVTAQSRNIIGGYLVGLTAGSLCALVSYNSFLLSIIMYSFAVGISIFVMVTTNTEHPPASGITLGIAIGGLSLQVVITIIVSAVVLSAYHHFFKHRLKDLI